jgi:hypothetical protein
MTLVARCGDDGATSTIPGNISLDNEEEEPLRRKVMKNSDAAVEVVIVVAMGSIIVALNEE